MGRVSSVDLEYRLFKAFDGRVSDVKLNFDCRCQANFGLIVACRVKKWANVRRVGMTPSWALFIDATQNHGSCE